MPAAKAPQVIGIVLIAEIRENTGRCVARQLSVQFAHPIAQGDDLSSLFRDAHDIDKKLGVTMRERGLIDRDAGNRSAHMLQMNLGSRRR